MKFRMTAIILALLTSSACYIYGLCHQTENRTYTGIRSLNASDYSTHLSWIEQSRQGQFFMKNKFTAEPQTGYFVRPVYFLLTQPFRLTPLSNTVVLQILRIVSGLALLILLFPILQKYDPDRAIVDRAFLLLVFTSGLGILTHGWMSSIDIDIPEAFLFLSLGEAPHFLYSLLFLWGGIAAIYAGAPAIYFFCLLVLWWEHPFEAVILISVALANLWILRDRKKQILTLIVTAGVSLPPFLYYQHLKKTPAFSGWGSAQNLMASPNILSVISGFLPLMLLAIAGFLYLKRRSGQKQLLYFLLIWIGVQTVLIYCPFPFQRRLIAGVQFPLALLAAYALREMRKLSLVALILILSMTNVWSSKKWINEIKSRQMPYYLSSSYRDALQWLSGQKDKDSVVLSGFVTGNFIPGFSGLTSYMGHSSLTPDVVWKKEEVLQFYQNSNVDFLVKNRIKFVFWGLEERHMTNIPLGSLLEVAYKNSEVMILLPLARPKIRNIARGSIFLLDRFR